MKTINQLAALLCSAALAVTAIPSVSSGNAVFAADTVSFTVADGWFETAYAEWEPVSGATGYQVYADGKQIDSILIRQYRSFYRVDIPGLKAGSHTVKVVPLISGKEDASKLL